MMADDHTSRGKGTVYEQLGVQGSCGELHGEHDAIAAISNEWMNGRYRHEFCGSKIKCTNKGNGKTIVLPVVDTCMGCTKSHVDFSIGAWNRLTDKAPWGIFDLEWYGIAPIIITGEKEC
jgi:hypothetical protein